MHTARQYDTNQPHKEPIQMAVRKKTTSKPTVKTAKADKGKIIDPAEPTGGLVDYLAQFRKSAGKKKGKQLENEIDAYLEAAKDDLSEVDFEKFKMAIAPHRLKKEIKKQMRVERKKNPTMTRAEYRQSKFLEAKKAGMWYPGHKACKDCGETDRKHYSGGSCTRCYTIARDKRLIEAGLKEDPTVKRQEREKLKAQREELRLEKAKERAARAKERSKKAAARAKKAEEAVAATKSGEPKPAVKKSAANKPAGKKVGKSAARTTVKKAS